MIDSKIKLAECNLGELTEVLIRGNGFGHETLWIKSYFDGKTFGIIEETPNVYMHNICQNTLIDFFKSKSFELNLETYYDDSGEVSVTYENLEIDLDIYKRIYKNAMLFFKNGNDSVCLCVNNYGPREISYRLYAPVKYNSLLKEWFTYSKKHSFYKNKKIDANLRFLKINTTTWDDIVLPSRIIKVIKNNISELFDMQEYLSVNEIPLKSGIILAGPPGVGKTILCKILAKELPITVLYAMPDSMGMTNDIKSLCEMAIDLAPCMMILEDLDYIAEEREYSRNSGGVMELMNYLDGLQEFNDIITLAKTNAIDKLEGAVKNRPGRFDRVIKIPCPDEDCRLRMFEIFTKKYTVKDVGFTQLVVDTEGLSGAHLKDLCKTAVRNAIRERSVDDKKIAILKNVHFTKALKEVQNIDYASHYKEQAKARSRAGFQN